VNRIVRLVTAAEASSAAVPPASARRRRPAAAALCTLVFGFGCASPGPAPEPADDDPASPRAAASPARTTEDFLSWRPASRPLGAATPTGPAAAQAAEEGARTPDGEKEKR
jgi:hypothetical protein